ncbi:NepR family anti-sigma factor [Tepidamorphus sp. 3E244]|uniref:NepR family anti-sigma factor n=1 Tax=Tepidamorphus sp. 3E244 TaxID=3385498 RepID=UPI0038FCCEE5
MIDPTSDKDSGGRSGFDPNNEIARKLRAFYSSLEEEPVPPRFIELLDKLDQAEQSAKGWSADDDS